MPGGRINREAWAEEVATLIQRFAPGPRGQGNKSAFARQIGLTTKTVDRWLARLVDVSYDSVRQVIESLDLSEQERASLLERVGYRGLAAVVPIPPLMPDDPRQDPVIQQILADPHLTQDERLELIQEQIAIIEADRQRRMNDYERMMRRLNGRRDVS